MMIFPFYQSVPMIGALFVILVFLPAVLAATEELVSNHRVFADKLMSELYRNDNECTSSLGISMAFDLVYQTGDETNLQQMQEVFGYVESSSSAAATASTGLQWSEARQRLNTKYDGRCLSPESATMVDECELEQPSLSIANRIWMADSLIVGEDVSQKLGSYLFQLDFNSGDAGSVINDWVDTSTNGLIKSIVDSGPLSGVQLVAVNSIYLKAGWMIQFAKQLTNVDMFYSSPSRLETRESQVNYMHAVNSFPYTDTAVTDYQILQLPFHGDLSMIIALPVLEDLSPIGSQDVFNALPQLQPLKVALAMPKFRFESTYEQNLKESMEGLGLTRAFETGLCFGGEGGCNGRLSEIIHKTVIDVNEEGVEAAAVTTTFARSSNPLGEPEVPILFLANHPFQFFIYDTNEELVIFEGRVSDPGADKDAEAPNLGWQHKDTDFWRENFEVEPRASSTSSSGASFLANPFLSLFFVVATVSVALVFV